MVLKIDRLYIMQVNYFFIIHFLSLILLHFFFRDLHDIFQLFFLLLVFLFSSSFLLQMFSSSSFHITFFQLLFFLLSFPLSSSHHSSFSFFFLFSSSLISLLIILSLFFLIPFFSLSISSLPHYFAIDRKCSTGYEVLWQELVWRGNRIDRFISFGWILSVCVKGQRVLWGCVLVVGCWCCVGV